MSAQNQLIFLHVPAGSDPQPHDCWKRSAIEFLPLILDNSPYPKRHPLILRLQDDAAHFDALLRKYCKHSRFETPVYPYCMPDSHWWWWAQGP